MRVISLIFLIVLNSLLMGEKVKVGIVGYTLLDEFRIIFDQNSTVTIDGQNLDIHEAIIYRDGVINYLGNEIIFNNLTITGGETTIFLSNKGPQTYSGDFTISYKDSLKIVNIVDKNKYFASVLASEMGDQYHDEALKAQLLAIKEFYYIRKERNIDSPWDILNTSRVMAYRGQEYETARATAIVNEMDGIRLILDPETEPMFFSTAAGYILKQKCISSNINNQPDDPVLITDNNINSPYYSFEVSVSKDQLIKIFNRDFDSLSLYYFKDTPLVDFVIFNSKEGKREYIKGYNFVSMVQRAYGSSFRSIQFKIEERNGIYTFKGNGFGHFIGLSQYGAQSKANDGVDYKEILTFYYPGVKFKDEKNLGQKKWPNK